MTKVDANRRLLGFLVHMLINDDEACFGPVGEDPGSQEYKALDRARQELVEEFNRRGAT